MLKIKPIEPTKVTSISCKTCGEKLPRVGLLPNSKIEGLTFRCKKCGTYYAVKTE